MTAFEDFRSRYHQCVRSGNTPTYAFVSHEFFYALMPNALDYACYVYSDDSYRRDELTVLGVRVIRHNNLEPDLMFAGDNK